MTDKSLLRKHTLTTSFFYYCEAMTVNANVKELYHLLKEKKPIFLVDVRENSEHRREHITEANLFPSSSLNPQKVVEAAGGKNLYIMCASGGRSAAAAKKIEEFIKSSPEFKNKVFNVSGGMSAWRGERFPVVEDKGAPLPIIRQVHIIASSLIIAGSLLGRFYNPNFFVLPAFVGCGLMVSGVTGFCGMALILQKLPYNQ